MLYLDGSNLSIKKFVNSVKNKEKIALTDEALNRIKESYNTLCNIINSGEIVYGVNTGIGDLARVKLPIESSKEFQHKLIVSHSVSVGDELPHDIIRGAMILRLNTFSRGYSGINPVVVELLINLVNNDIIPLVREIGSLGASGDLALLAGIAMVLIGEGEAYYKGKLSDSKTVLRNANLKPVELSLKDGLALINGTSFMASMGAFAMYNSVKQFKMKLLLSALTIESLGGKSGPFEREINSLRKSNGQEIVAYYLRNFIKDSKLIDNPDTLYIQDPYTFRCIPQILGGIYDLMMFANDVVQREMNTPSDNPLVLVSQNRVISGGNFHGEPIALALDSLSLAVSEIGSLSERHINRLLDPHLSSLPPFLAQGSGINSGMMILHYAASDALTENKVLTHPSSTDTASVSAQQEDHCSLGFLSSRKLMRIIKNNWHILSMETICALQAMEMRGIDKASTKAKYFHKTARKYIPFIEEDILMYPIIDKSENFIKMFNNVD